MTGIKDILDAVFPPKNKELKDTFEEYSKKVLDKPAESGYNDSNNGSTPTAVIVVPVEEKKEPTVVEEQKKAPEVTVEQIVNTPGDAYPAYVIELAKILRDMKLQYSLHASAFSAKLFDAQDSLGLTSEEVRTIIGHIIDQKDVIIKTTQSSIDVINKKS